MRLLLILLALSAPVTAAELELGAWTTHLISEQVNNDNRLMGVEWRGIEAATFINSFDDRSYALGYRFTAPGPFSVSVGLIDGYGENSKFFPITHSEVVAYVSLNATVPLSDHVAVRARVMGEVVMVSGVLY